MKKFALLLTLVLGLATWAFSDEITFSIIGPGVLTAAAAGVTAGQAEVEIVTDITTGKRIELYRTFTTSAGAAHSITVTTTNYTGFFSPGATDSVNVGDVLLGNMLDNSEVTAVNDGAGSFSGEFHVTFIHSEILKEFNTGPSWNPTGSIGITFHDADISGTTLVGAIGGGSATVLTVETTPIPEAQTFMLFFFGVGTLILARQARTNFR
jgi:hypothetical protein